MFKPETVKQWPWNASVIYTISLVYIFAWMLITFNLWHQFSNTAFFSVILLLPLFIYIFRYKKINKMITVLKGCISAQNGETAEGLVCLNGVVSPGIAIMRDNLFILIPVTGRRTKVFFENITAINETKSVALKYLFAKRVFNVEVGENKSVSFAVRESVGKRWWVMLTERLTQRL